MAKKVFLVGDLVFAKVRGYPAWPARVTGKTSGGKCSVFFYGTWEVGNMRPVEMWPYTEKFRQRFGPANMHKKWYSEGLYQIEHSPEIAFHQSCDVGVQGDEGVQEDVDGFEQVTKAVLVKDFSTSDLKEVQVSVDDLYESDLAENSLKLACDGDVVRKVIMSGDKIEVRKMRSEMVVKVEKIIKENIFAKKKEKLMWLKTEKKLVELVWMIRKVMSSNTPDLAKCMELLEIMETVEIEPLMVIKLPEVFYTVKKLSMEWQGGSGECLAGQVREMSWRVNVKILALFDMNSDNSSGEFSHYLEKKVAEFKDQTNGLSERDILSFTNKDFFGLH